MNSIYYKNNAIKIVIGRTSVYWDNPVYNMDPDSIIPDLNFSELIYDQAPPSVIVQSLDKCSSADIDFDTNDDLIPDIHKFIKEAWDEWIQTTHPGNSPLEGELARVQNHMNFIKKRSCILNVLAYCCCENGIDECSDDIPDLSAYFEDISAFSYQKIMAQKIRTFNALPFTRDDVFGLLLLDLLDGLEKIHIDLMLTSSIYSDYPDLYRYHGKLWLMYDRHIFRDLDHYNDDPNHYHPEKSIINALKVLRAFDPWFYETFTRDEFYRYPKVTWLSEYLD